MDDVTKQRILEDRDKLLKSGVGENLLPPTPRDLLTIFERGGMLSELKTALCMARMQYREIIPISTHIPSGAKKLLKDDRFRFSINQEFKRVMEECAKPRLDPEDIWIRERIKRGFRDLHSMGYASSIEVYRDDQLVSGILGLHRGASFIGVTVFSRTSGGGNAAMIATQGVLEQNGFRLHDAIIPSRLSRHFGGYMIETPDYLQMQSEAQSHEACLRRSPIKLLS